MEKIEEMAFISVGRGCGFTALAIATFMFGLSGNIVVAFQSGGMLCLMVCLILVLRGVRAPQNPYKRTEVWMMLAPTDRPPEAFAQTVVGSALRRSYLRFALHFAFASAFLLAGSLFFKMIQADG